MVPYQDLMVFPLFKNMPSVELIWLYENSYEVMLKAGDIFIEQDDNIEEFYIFLEGDIKITQTVDIQEITFNCYPTHQIGGMLSLFYNIPSLVTIKAIQPTRLRLLKKQQFRNSFSTCPVFTSWVFKVAVEQAQQLGLLNQQIPSNLKKKVQSSAVTAQRTIATLQKILPTLQAWAMKLNSLGLTTQQIDNLLTFQQTIIINDVETFISNQDDQIEEIRNWLAQYNLDTDITMISILFVEMGVTLTDLQIFTKSMSNQIMDEVLLWLYETCSAFRLFKALDSNLNQIIATIHHK